MQHGPKGAAKTPKEPLKCWECEGTHVKRNLPLLGESNKIVHNLQKDSTVGEIVNNLHWIKFKKCEFFKKEIEISSSIN